MAWKVYDKTGNTVRCTLKGLEYNGTWMGACFVTSTLESAVPILFEIGDYVMYRGEKFEINYDPTALKKAARKTSGEAFVYDNVKFNGPGDELTRCDFLDYVKSDNQIHFPSLPKFSFFASSIQDLADRVQVNLDRIYTGAQKWTVTVHPEYVNEANKSISISSINVWDALALVKSEFKANFIIRGRTITIGTAGIAVGNMFGYGKGKGLYSIQKTADSSQKIITRLRAYGGTKNLPHNYYTTYGSPIVEAPIEDVSYGYDPNTHLIHGAVVTLPFYMEILSDAALYDVTINGRSYKMERGSYLGKCYVLLNSEADKDNVRIGAKMRIEKGIETDNVPRKYKRPSGALVPNNMAVRNLMLPDFPEKTLDPYLDSKNIDIIGVREGSVFFDGSDTSLPEIYPSMEGMTAQQLKDAGIYVSLDAGDNGNLDEVADAEQLTDDGTMDSLKEGEDVPPFTITLKDVGFNINDYLTSETATISMKNGMCGGRDFEITKCEKKGNKYVLTCNRVYDESLKLYFPYKDYNIKSGDKFVLLYIDMPDVYIQAASQRLLATAKKYLAKNDYVRYSYEPKVDDIFMARQHDEAVARGEASIHDTLKEGDLMLFTDSDLGIEGNIIIDTLIIKEGEDMIPKYTMTLREEKAVGSLEKIQNQIDSIAGGGQGTGGLNTQQIQSIIRSLGNQLFLSRTHNDTAAGLIGFLAGAIFGASGFAEGLAGFGAKIDSMGRGYMESLTLRRFLEVPELRFNRAEIVLGDKWRSPGAGIIESVEPDYDTDGNLLRSGTISLKLQDGEIGAVAVDDICMGYFHDYETPGNNAVSDIDDSRGNRMFAGFCTIYFRITEILDAGTNKRFRYVLRGVSDRWQYSFHPCEALHFVAYGNFTNKERQTSAYETRTYRRFLVGVNDWEFTKSMVAMQDGDLSNLNIFGLDMTGYSAYLNNIYMTGTIEQLQIDVPVRIEIDTQGDNFLAYGESMEITCKVFKGWEDITDAVRQWAIRRDSGDTADDEAWNIKHKDFNGSITIHNTKEISDLGNNSVTVISTLFTITATNDTASVEAIVTI